MIRARNVRAFVAGIAISALLVALLFVRTAAPAPKPVRSSPLVTSADQRANTQRQIADDEDNTRLAGIAIVGCEVMPSCELAGRVLLRDSLPISRLRKGAHFNRPPPHA